MTQQDINDLRDLLAAGKTKQALAQLRTQNKTMPNTELRDQVILLAARWKKYEQEERMQLKDSTILNIELQQINYACLGLLNELEEWYSNEASKITVFKLQLTSNKGSENLQFRSGESMQFYVQVNKPCFVRLIYQLASGESVLLCNNHAILSDQLHQNISIVEPLIVDAPFGTEHLYAYAQSMAFGNLNTELHEDGYELVIGKHIPEWSERGFKKKAYAAASKLVVETTPS